MSPELIAILAVGVALAGLMVRGQLGLDKRIDELRKDITGLDARLRAVETGLAAIDGKLSFVENYILGRNARGPETTEAGADE